jgi:subtilisin-like proprotein convertase family protein
MNPSTSRSSIASPRAYAGIETLEARVAPAGLIFAASAGTVKTFTDADNNGTYETIVDSFVPFAGYRKEIRTGTGDFDGDGNTELVLATATRTPRILVFDLGTDGTRAGAGELILPFAGSRSVGVWVATGDLDGDGKDELFVGAGHGGPANVEIYSDTDGDTLLGDNLVDTLVVFDATFKGGVRVAAANVNNSGGDDLVAAAGRGRNGQIEIHVDGNADRILSTEAAPFETFSPFGAKFTGGLIVAAGIIDGAGGAGAEVAVARSSASNNFLIFTDTNANGLVGDNPEFDTVVASPRPVAGGLRLALGDTDNSGIFVEAIVSSGGGRVLPIQIFDDNNDAAALLSDNPPEDSFAAFPAGATVNVAFGKVGSVAFASGNPVFLSDSATVNASIFVPANAGIIRDLDLRLSITHTHNPDLDVTLTHLASGISVVLFTDIPATSADGIFVILNDESGEGIENSSAASGTPVTGSFNLEGAALLSAFDGLDASGEWRLTITDDAGGDTGTLLGWSLIISV